MKLVLLLIIATMLQGCASKQHLLIENVAESDRATLSIYRTASSYHKFNPEKPYVYVDQVFVGKLGTGEALQVQVKSGSHKVVVKDTFAFMPASVVASFVFEVNALNHYYIRYSKEMDQMGFTGMVAYTTSIDDIRFANESEYYARN